MLDHLWTKSKHQWWQNVLREVNSQSHITLTLTANLYRDQWKLALGSTYHSLSSYQVHCIVMILSQMAMDLHVWCASFVSFQVVEALLIIEALLVGIHVWTSFLHNGCCRACSCSTLAVIFWTNSHPCGLHPNNAPQNDADTIYRSKFPNLKQYLTTGQMFSCVKSCKSGVGWVKKTQYSVYCEHCLKSNDYWCYCIDLYLNNGNINWISDCIHAVVYCDILSQL